MSSTSVETIEAAIRRALTSRGPLTEDDVLEVLLSDGLDLGPEPEDLLSEVLDSSDDLVLGLLNGTFAFLPALLDGRIFTHRLSAVEAENDMLQWGPDISVVSMLTEDETYQKLVDGSLVVDAIPGVDDELLAERGLSPYRMNAEGALLFEPGQFSQLGVSAGDILGLEVNTDGFALVAVEDVMPSDAGEKIAELYDEHAEGPMTLLFPVWLALAVDVNLLREPATPLSEQLSANGLVVEGEWVAREGFSFDIWRNHERRRQYKATYRLQDDEAQALADAVDMYDISRDIFDATLDAAGDGADIEAVAPHVLEHYAATHTPTAADLDPTHVPRTLGYLEHPVLANAFLTETIFGDERSPVALGLFADTMEARAPRAARPALRWLRGRALEQLGHLEDAERAFRDAEAMDQDWPLALMSLARYASDRGDTERGLALLRRAGAPSSHPLVALLQAFQDPPRPKLARNQPCWCGSGRKYKQCHLHGEQLPLEERAAWLYQKAGLDLVEGSYAPLLMEAAYVRSAHWDTPDALEQAFTDGLATDAVMFEGGAFEEFLTNRGSLLPPDEAMLGAQWLLTERSVHEVVSVAPGESMVWRDVRTGDVNEIRERTASRQVKPGQLYCARVVPAGDTMQIFGGLEPVSVGQRDHLITLLDSEPNPLDLVAFLSERFAPPVLQNTGTRGPHAP